LEDVSRAEEALFAEIAIRAIRRGEKRGGGEIDVWMRMWGKKRNEGGLEDCVVLKNAEKVL